MDVIPFKVTTSPTVKPTMALMANAVANKKQKNTGVTLFPVSKALQIMILSMI